MESFTEEVVGYTFGDATGLVVGDAVLTVLNTGCAVGSADEGASFNVGSCVGFFVGNAVGLNVGTEVDETLVTARTEIKKMTNHQASRLGMKVPRWTIVQLLKNL